VELRQLDIAVAVRGPNHGDVDPHAVEPVEAVHPTSLDRRLTLQLHAEFEEERDGSPEVVHDDAHVIHPLDRHVASVGAGASAMTRRRCRRPTVGKRLPERPS
jgi:hypothetical protein